MSNRNEQGVIAEAKTIADLSSNGWDVYIPIGGKSCFDLVAYKDGVLERIQVKSTRTSHPSGNWKVMLKSVRPNRTGNTVHKFNADLCDRLAVWIVEEDRIVYLDPKLLHNRNETTITRKGQPIGGGTALEKRLP